MTYLYIDELKAVVKYSAPYVFFMFDAKQGWIQDEWAISAVRLAEGNAKEITEAEAKQIVKSEYSFSLFEYLSSEGISKENLSLEGVIEYIAKKSHSAVSKGTAREAIVLFASDPGQRAFVFGAPSDDCRIWICLNAIQFITEDEKMKTAAKQMMSDMQLSQEDATYINTYGEKKKAEKEKVNAEHLDADIFRNFIYHVASMNAQLPDSIEMIVRYTEALGLKLHFADEGRGNLITPVYNITFTKPKKDEYKGKVRFDHKLSKLAIKNRLSEIKETRIYIFNRLSEKRIVEMFRDFEANMPNAAICKNAVVFADEYIYVIGDIFCNDDLAKEYMELICTIAKVHFPPKTKLIGVDEFLSTGFERIKPEKNGKPMDSDFAGNARLEELIHAFHENQCQDTHVAVLNYLLQIAAGGGKLYMPFAIKDIEKKDFVPLTIQGANDTHWLPLYTHEEDIVAKDMPVAVGRVTVGDAIKSSLGFDIEVGVVINPTREAFAIVREGVKELLEILEKQS